MKFTKRSSVLALFCALTSILHAQNIQISSTESDSLFVCHTDTFTVIVQNNHPVLLTGALLTVGLPSGLTYSAGTVIGAAEQDISDLAEPIFGLPDIPASQSVTVKFMLIADCDAAIALDAGLIFKALISVSSMLGNLQISSDEIPVETGALIIESVSPHMLAGEIGDTLLRKICVQSTREGNIGNLYFEDSHLDGFSISVAEASSQTNSAVFFSAEFDGSFFQTVGNGDIWLDKDESVCFTEQIIVTSCGNLDPANPSFLRAGWGCGGEICRYFSYDTSLLIQINPSTKFPILVVEQIWSPPTDYCGNIPAVMGFKIKNIGNVEATAINFNITLTDGLTLAGILPNSFRIVSTTGTNPIAASDATPTFLPACNLTVVREGDFLIPIVEAGDSIQFLFDVITCVARCGEVQAGFRVDYRYGKDCPPSGFVSENALIIPKEGYSVNGVLHSSNTDCFQNGGSYPFSYETWSRYMSETGFVHFELHLPPGFSVNDSCAIMLGNIPPALVEYSPLPGGESLAHFAWATPLPEDTMRMDFCLRFLCDTNIVCEAIEIDTNGGIIYTEACCFLGLENAAYWSPALNTPRACGINDCEEHILGVACVNSQGPPPQPCEPPYCDTIFPLPGLQDWWNVYRLNLGYQDDDDDRHADNSLPASPGLVRLDRFLAGDTLRVEYCGVMTPGNWTVDTIRRAIWHEIVGSDMGVNDNDLFLTSTAKTGFTDSSKVRFLSNTIRVRYADGTEAICPWGGLKYVKDQNYFTVENPNAFPPVILDDVATEKFFFLFSLKSMFSSGCLPKPYIEEGDSIFILSDFKLDVNYRPNSNNIPDPPLVGFRTASSAGGKIFALNLQDRKYLQYSGWKKTFTANTHNIKLCENSSESKKFNYSMRIARENLFPYELRPLASISDYRQTVLPGLELAFAKLEYLTLQDNVPFLSNLALPFSESPGLLDVDFSPAFAQLVDEGFNLRSNLAFKPNCQFSIPDSSVQYIETSFVGCLNGGIMSAQDSIKNPIGFYSNTPRLELLTANNVVFSPTRAFEIDFDLMNQLGLPAPFAWVAIGSPSGLASDFELYQMPQNQLLVGTNDLYNLGNIAGDSTKHFKLKGQNLACETDSLLLIFGWACSPISSLADADCGLDTFVFELHLERPELELDIIQEPASITLCDTSDYFEFEIYNAKIGYAYDLEASLKLPPGLNIVPGSCQISYPDGAQWVNIPDPMLLGSNLFQWELNSTLPSIATSGLPGVNLAPANTFKIRFKTLAECGFVANTPIIYGTSGVEPCGRQSNLLNKPGEPLHIIGFNPTYGVQINLQAIGNPGVACESTQAFSVTLNILGTPTLGDSVFILLPQGVLFLVDSYSPGLNAPTGPPTVDSLGFQLPLPMLAGGGTMQFGFEVALGAAAGCNDQLLIAQTRMRSVAFCQSLGDSCAVFISTGESSVGINPAHPQLSASSPNLSISNGQVNGAITVTNIGIITANGALVQVWRDLDGDGMLSANDVLLQVLQTPSPIAPGASAQLSGVLAGLDSTQLCGLLFVLPAEENCACNEQVFALEHLNLEHTGLVFCELTPAMIGVPEQAGFTYQWIPTTGIGCANCPNTTYTPDPNTPPNTVKTLSLVESSSNCTITHNFEITFGASALIIVDNATICQGESTQLMADPPGIGYVWEGLGITNPNLQTQTVQPSVSATYTVTISFSNGCTASASSDISVLAADTTQLVGLKTCAGDPVNVLGTITATAGNYQIVLEDAAGCDSTILQTLTVMPDAMTQEERVFCYGDSVLVFDSLFTTSGQISKIFSSVNGCDSTHLVTVTENGPPILIAMDTVFATFGQIITLHGPNNYVTYIWEPMPTPPCPNCQSVTYLPDSLGYHECLLTVAGINGCPEELLFRVFIFPPCSADSLYIPNAFTPNGDGANDVFRVVQHEGAEVVSSLEIYDRWGQKVYENQGDSSWDGRIDGQPGPSDVYVYIITVTCGELVGKRVGDVTLLR